FSPSRRPLVMGPGHQIKVKRGAGVMLSAPFALCNFLPQIRQPNMGTVALNQFLLLIATRASAFPGRQTHYAGRIVAKPERTAVHWNILFRPPIIWVVVGVLDA